jgi:hypothetical protein
VLACGGTLVDQIPEHPPDTFGIELEQNAVQRIKRFGDNVRHLWVVSQHFGPVRDYRMAATGKRYDDPHEFFVGEVFHLEQSSGLSGGRFADKLCWSSP